MLRSVLPQPDRAKVGRVLPVFIVNYGQHRIGIARAHHGEEAGQLISALFPEKLTGNRLNTRELTGDELAGYASLVDGDEETVLAVLL